MEHGLRQVDVYVKGPGSGREMAIRALQAAGRLDEAWLIERGTMPDERILRLKDVEPIDCPYFAIVLVHGRGRRQELCE